MWYKGKMAKRIWAVLLALLVMVCMAGCQDSKAEDSNAAGEAVSDESETAAEPESRVTQLSGDCVISAEEMEAIAGSGQEHQFVGTTEEGIGYTWTYNGKLIKNPQEQCLKVTVDNRLTEDVKTAANNAGVGLGITLESMHMAAPATLELVLTEKWDADSVVFCKYMDGKALRISNCVISSAFAGGEEVTSLSFQVQETGDTYYLVGGKNGDGAEAGGTGTNGQASETDTAGSNSSVAGTDGSSSEDTTDGGSQEEGQEGTVHTCTISIECSTILDNWDDLKQSKAEFVPTNGWILYPSEVEFTEGETVFDILKRVCKETDIHISSRYTPMYGSYYIEGLNQLYEFDCGQDSGWMYRVNGWYPNYGCSSYEVSDGDKIEWRYTCDLGVDVGGGSY